MIAAPTIIKVWLSRKKIESHVRIFRRGKKTGDKFEVMRIKCLIYDNLFGVNVMMKRQVAYSFIRFWCAVVLVEVLKFALKKPQLMHSVLANLPGSINSTMCSSWDWAKVSCCRKTLQRWNGWFFVFWVFSTFTWNQTCKIDMAFFLSSGSLLKQGVNQQ